MTEPRTYCCSLCEGTHEVGDPNPHGYDNGPPDADGDWSSLWAVPLGVLLLPLVMLGIVFGLLNDE